MKPTINLFFDMEFTSLSPDAQIISLGIVSDMFWNSKLKQEDDKPYSKSFYAEFSDFQIERCDDWVKENVVGKLKFQNSVKFFEQELSSGCLDVFGNTKTIKESIFKFLSQFSDYNIQFVADCCTWDWYWMMNLLAEWDEKDIDYITGEEGYKITCEKNIIICCGEDYEISCTHKIGLPKLPENISPVPQDLNDLILLKYLRKVVPYSTVLDAFNANRETLMYLLDEGVKKREMYDVVDNTYILKTEKHNSLWDAKVIKAIYNKLK